MSDWQRLLIFLLLFCFSSSANAAAPEDWSLHFQSTGVGQADAPFHSSYSGPNSLRLSGEIRETVTSTLFLGRKLWEGGEFYINPELSQGTGLSGSLGVAGFPNGEATRAGNLKTSLFDRYFLWSNTARLFLRQTFNFGDKNQWVESEANQLAGKRAPSRLTFTVGKLSALDIFDDNAYSHDPRTQFLNWALMTNGAWDYPADAKGYTNGLAAEYYWNRSAVRLGSFMVPRAANGVHLDPHIGNASGNVLELENGYTVLNRDGKLRFLGYMNHAHMGKYKDAMDSPDIDVTESRKYRFKFGLGINAEQKITEDLGVFTRLGWNDGQTETWAFTEIDRTFSMGLSLKGGRWHRSKDTFGLAWVLNGLSKDHENYLKAGGTGFIIGDGALSYSLEKIIETYYDIHLVKQIFLAFNYQLINNPGYNSDRGPVSIFSSRLHLEI